MTIDDVGAHDQFKHSDASNNMPPRKSTPAAPSSASPSLSSSSTSSLPNDQVVAEENERQLRQSVYGVYLAETRTRIPYYDTTPTW